MATPRRGKKSIDRRGFLALGGAGLTAAALGSFPRSLGAAIHNGCRGVSQQPVLVTIYLRGGADGLNVVIPYSDPEYAALRPRIAIPAEDDADEKGVLRLDERFGLHPALAPLMPHYEAGRLAPIVCVGSQHPTRSHFDAQDFMEYAAPGARGLTDGWLNRYLSRTHGPGRDSRLRGLAMQRLLPRSLRGRHPTLAASPRSSRETELVLSEFEELYGVGGDANGEMNDASMRREEAGAVKVGRETIETLRELEGILKAEDASATAVKYPPGPLSQPLAGVAKVVKAKVGLEVSCLDYGGFDTHINQGASSGPFANLMNHLASALGAFAEDLGDEFKRTLVLVMTEFGRTCRENGNSGTDHGHGSFMFAFGGNVKGTGVRGTWPGLDEKNLYAGRDLQVTTDFRTVFDEVLLRHMGFDAQGDFFPDYERAKFVGLLES